MKEESKLFRQGVAAFNTRRFYDAHEYWEEIWLNYKLSDTKCIQGLIQLAVSFFHYHNGNPKGAKSMAAKCIKKFEGHSEFRGILVSELLSGIKQYQSFLDNDKKYNNINSYYITLKAIHE